MVGHALTENERLDAALEEIEDCSSSFKHSTVYTKAHLSKCPTCGRLWLRGYDENFGGLPVEAEWGKRTWSITEATEDLVDQIHAAAGRQTLDVTTFGDPEKTIWIPGDPKTAG